MLASGFVHDLLQLSAKLALVMLIFVPLERLFAVRRQKVLRPEIRTDLGYYFINGLSTKLLLILPVSLLAYTVHHVLPWRYYMHVAALPVWVRLIAALVVGDVGFYWAHRWMHEVKWLWPIHAIHHSPTHMDWLVNSRAHPLDMVLGRLGGLVPMYVLGLAQPMGNRLDVVPLLFALIGSLWGFFIHANVYWRLGPLEWLVATPAFHHWHHTNDGPEFVDRNYASMLPWIDRIFGTHYLPRHLPATYGIRDPLPPDLAGQLLHPFEARRTAPAVAEPAKAAQPEGGESEARIISAT